MSGVIDENGQQWEHCNVCGKFVKLQNLGYDPPSVDYPHGRDICITCTNVSPRLHDIQPAASWRAIRG